MREIRERKLIRCAITVIYVQLGAGWAKVGNKRTVTTEGRCR